MEINLPELFVETETTNWLYKDTNTPVSPLIGQMKLAIETCCAILGRTLPISIVQNPN